MLTPEEKALQHQLNIREAIEEFNSQLISLVFLYDAIVRVHKLDVDCEPLPQKLSPELLQQYIFKLQKYLDKYTGEK